MLLEAPTIDFGDAATPLLLILFFPTGDCCLEKKPTNLFTTPPPPVGDFLGSDGTELVPILDTDCTVLVEAIVNVDEAFAILGDSPEDDGCDGCC